jgi:hypothetical protein
MLGGFHTALLVFLRGSGGARILVVFLAAALGAWAGDAAGARLGIEPIRLGDFHFVSASVLAWAGIAFVEVLFILGPTSPADRSRG